MRLTARMLLRDVKSVDCSIHALETRKTIRGTRTHECTTTLERRLLWGEVVAAPGGTSGPYTPIFSSIRLRRDGAGEQVVRSGLCTMIEWAKFTGIDGLPDYLRSFAHSSSFTSWIWRDFFASHAGITPSSAVKNFTMLWQ